MSLPGGSPEGGSETSGNLPQIANQRKRLAVGADMECKLDDDMPSYFAQSNFGLCIGRSVPGSVSLTCGEIYTANVMAPGACANCT